MRIKTQTPWFRLTRKNISGLAAICSLRKQRDQPQVQDSRRTCESLENLGQKEFRRNQIANQLTIWYKTEGIGPDAVCKLNKHVR